LQITKFPVDQTAQLGQGRSKALCRIVIGSALSFGGGKDDVDAEAAASATCALPTRLDDDDPAEKPARKAHRRNRARLIRKVWIDNPEECTECGERME